MNVSPAKDQWLRILAERGALNLVSANKYYLSI
jgi:hypothetical protein